MSVCGGMALCKAGHTTNNIIWTTKVSFTMYYLKSNFVYFKAKFLCVCESPSLGWIERRPSRLLLSRLWARSAIRCPTREISGYKCYLLFAALIYCKANKVHYSYQFVPTPPGGGDEMLRRCVSGWIAERTASQHSPISTVSGVVQEKSPNSLRNP